MADLFWFIALAVAIIAAFAIRNYAQKAKAALSSDAARNDDAEKDEGI